jgi:uncharacterized protein (TIGR03083 family)
MATHLSLEQHLEAIARGGAALREAAAAAGPDAKVPTCPAWDVTDLVVHQGMVHRWAAANLRGEHGHDTAASKAEGRAAARLLDWFADGVAALVDTVRSTPEDAEATVFLKDAPPPRRFWARTAPTRSRPPSGAGRPRPTSASTRHWPPTGSTSW